MKRTFPSQICDYVFFGGALYAAAARGTENRTSFSKPESGEGEGCSEDLFSNTYTYTSGIQYIQGVQ
jgi:hypothetical protein